MKKVLLLTLLAFFLGNVYAQEEKVKGIWYNTDKTSKIKIFKATNGKYYGKIVWLEDEDKKDIHNPDETKQNDPVLGMMFVKGFTYDTESGKWEGGTIYDPDNGKTYDCFMWFEEGVSEELNVKGYIMGMKFAGRQVKWAKTTL